MQDTAERIMGSIAGQVSTARNALDLYKSWVRENHGALVLVDDIVSRVLYLAPANSSEDSRHWQHVLWGCLHLHRLAVELVTDERLLTNSHGTTVSLIEPDGVANAVRLGLSMLQCIGPIIQEFVSYNKERPAVTARMRTKVRFWLESIRFAFRLVLLGRYWRRSLSRYPCLVPGILLRGGVLDASTVPTACDELAALELAQYRGRRTGRRVCPSSWMPEVPIGNARRAGNPWRVMVAEVLYISRPLVLATAESSGRTGGSLMPLWIYSITMDLVSLAILSDHVVTSNRRTADEYRRRQVRLLLYLLRPPVWSRTTRPTIERLAATTGSVPLVGKLIASLIWDLAYHWKVYWAEEG